MQSLNNFLKSKHPEIKDIILKLGNEFNSHNFIEGLTHQFEGEYIDYLNFYRGKGAFQKVHGIIARYLSKHKAEFNIEKSKKVGSEHIFGKIDHIQQWKKL
jgi:hypothetical protein